MPKSRRRKPRRRTVTPARLAPGSGVDPSELETLRPWIETMMAMNAAERAGDAAEALRLITTHPVDAEGRPFWRACRVERLGQALLLGHDLPAWAVSRWLVAQAHDDLGTPRDRRHRRAEQIAVEVRGGLDGLSSWGEQDARCKIMDHDWVYRQVFTYELGGLSRFLRSYAAPELVARSDRVHEWAQAPMCALALAGRRPGTTTWLRLDTEECIETANVGSAALVADGEHVLGRLVPVTGGSMLEGAPLVVPRSVAERVAADPGAWIEAIADARDDLETGGFEPGLLHDIRAPLWQVALLDSPDSLPDPSQVLPHLARRALAVARACLDSDHAFEPGDLDLWACLRAALLTPSVVAVLPEVAGVGDREVLQRLGAVLAPPADARCRQLAARLGAAA